MSPAKGFFMPLTRAVQKPTAAVESDVADGGDPLLAFRDDDFTRGRGTRQGGHVVARRRVTLCAEGLNTRRFLTEASTVDTPRSDATNITDNSSQHEAVDGDRGVSGE